MDSEILQLQWTEHSCVFSDAVLNLRGNNSFSDATLACEGRFFPVHKFVLSTCSNYFSVVFDMAPCFNPVIVINNIACQDLEYLLTFMYCGEASIPEHHLSDVIKAADCLCIKGLTVNQKFPLPKNKPVDSPDLLSPKKDVAKRVPCSHVPNTTLSPDKMEYAPPLYVSSNSTIPSATRNANSRVSQQIPSLSPIVPSVARFADNAAKNPKNGVPIRSHSMNHDQSMQELPVQDVRMNDQAKVSSPYTDSQLPMNSFGQDCYNAEKSKLSLLPKMNESFSDFSSNGRKNDKACQSPLPNEKIMNEDFQLDGTVKELQIATEDGTVTIPDILEGFVDIKNLYDEKLHGNNSDNVGPKQSHLSHSSQNLHLHGNNAPSPSGAQGIKEETNDSMYEFDEDLPDTSTAYSKDTNGKPRLLKRDSESDETELPAKRKRTPCHVYVPSTSKSPEEHFTCSLCSRVYKQRETLRRHVCKNDEYPYKCTQCTLKFKTHREFTSHSKSHDTIKCDQCSYTTNRKENLRRHLKRHSEKLYKCTYENCNQAFIGPQQLQSHILTHMKQQATEA